VILIDAYRWYGTEMRPEMKKIRTVQVAGAVCLLTDLLLLSEFQQLPELRVLWGDLSSKS
jgi:hypothetical protein